MELSDFIKIDIWLNHWIRISWNRYFAKLLDSYLLEYPKRLWAEWKKLELSDFIKIYIWLNRLIRISWNRYFAKILANFFSTFLFWSNTVSNLVFSLFFRLSGPVLHHWGENIFQSITSWRNFGPNLVQFHEILTTLKSSFTENKNCTDYRGTPCMRVLTLDLRHLTNLYIYL